MYRVPDETKPALLKRFVSSGELPPGMLTDFNEDKQLLRINKDEYDLADERTKITLWRATGSLVRVYPKEP